MIKRRKSNQMRLPAERLARRVCSPLDLPFLYDDANIKPKFGACSVV